MRAFFGAALLAVLLELVHSAWLVRLPVAGQIADPGLAFVVAVGLRRPSWGPIAGVALGLLQDLLFGGSLGLFALPKLLVGQGAALLAGLVLADQPLLPWLATAGATVVHQVVLTLVVSVAGLLPVSAAQLGLPLLVQIGLNVFAAWPVFVLARLALPRRRIAAREGLRGA